MGFFSFAGRVLFASVFILSAWLEYNEFGTDGGPAAKLWAPKFEGFSNLVTRNVGFQLPEVDIKHLVAAAITLKGVGGVLFIFGNTFAAYLLVLHLVLSTPILYDFYNYDIDTQEFSLLFFKFKQNLALFGALLFFLGMKNSIPKRQPKKKSAKTKMN
ncbi:uncharacterized protein [Aristolochia californica]|uniref:uncharacterized protein n=1 Tax=Aristolochia californica TaxID=171875 RepID=UPI0035DA566C